MRFFSPFPHGTSTLSVSKEYLALPDGAGKFTRDFSGPALLRIPALLMFFRIRGYHPLWPSFPELFRFHIRIFAGPTTPHRSPDAVWAPPLSLATTCGITIVLFSSRYLDVSVPRVLPLAGVRSSTGRVAPFGHPRIQGRLRLPVAFRSLPRPSSSLGA